MNFEGYLNEAVEKLEALDPETFFQMSLEAQDEFVTKYVQHTALDARNWFPFIRIDGTLENTSRVHFGNGGTENLSIVKRAVYQDGYRPLVSDNALAGMFRIPLYTMSRRMWSDDEEVRECGYFTEKGSRFQCLKCLACGLGGGLQPDTSVNAVHKVRAVTGASEDAEIITEYQSSIEPRLGTTPKKELLGITDQRVRLSALWQTEYVAPGAHFNVSMTFRDVAAVEFGLALMAFDTSWVNIGLGAHKNGRFKGWNERPEAFTLYAWMDNWLAEPETYSTPKNLINSAKKSAYLAQEKTLLRKYVFDRSKLKAVHTAEQRVAT